MGIWLQVFVVVTALAVVLQAGVLIALFVTLRRTAEQVEKTVTDLDTKLMPLISRVQLLVEDVSPRISGIVSDASDITRMARGEAQKVDRILNEALERLRMQLIHVDHILTGAMEAVEEAGSRLRQTVWGPVMRATAIVRGVQAGVEFIRSARQQKRGRVDPIESAPEQQDEGMFI
jgi:hypothetical protein